MPKTVDVEVGSPEWLEERKKYIGASEAAAALGLSAYSSPIEVCLKKRGVLPEEPASKPMRRGLAMEAPIALAYAKLVGAKLLPTKFMVHENGFMACTPDAFIKGANRHLQVKTAGFFTKEAWGDPPDGVPDYYYIQVAHEMAVCGTNSCDLVVLFAAEEMFDTLIGIIKGGGTKKEKAVRLQIAADIIPTMDFRVYTITRNLEFEKVLIEQEREFWEDYVKGGKTPPYDGSEAARKHLLSLHPEATGIIRDAVTAELKLIEKFREENRKEGAAKAESDRLKQLIIKAIGDDIGLTGDFGKVKWYNAKESKSVSWKGVALEMNATKKAIAKHTTITAPTRKWSAKFTK